MNRYRYGTGNLYFRYGTYFHCLEYLVLFAVYMFRKCFHQMEINFGGVYSKLIFSEDRCRQFDSLFSMVRYWLIDASHNLRIDNRLIDRLICITKCGSIMKIDHPRFRYVHVQKWKMIIVKIEFLRAFHKVSYSCGCFSYGCCTRGCYSCGCSCGGCSLGCFSLGFYSSGCCSRGCSRGCCSRGWYPLCATHVAAAPAADHKLLLPWLFLFWLLFPWLLLLLLLLLKRLLIQFFYKNIKWP